MPHLLESTRNYLKSSTKIGRRLSSYRDDMSGSETSLHAPSSDIKQKQHRRSNNRLSSLFAFEGKNRNSISSEDRVTISITPAKVDSESQDDELHDKKKKRRNSSSKKSTASTSSSDLPASAYHNVPRGPSPSISISPTIRTVASNASYYDSRPSDYPTVDEYNSHVWRRTLLEESIMHSLNLGYGQVSQRSLKRSATGRSRSDSSGVRSSNGKANTTLTVIDRNIPTASRIFTPQQEKVLHKNSPYQQLNPSSTNITQSYASFTLELPEHQVTHVISASAVPNLFTLKMGQTDAVVLELGISESKENIDPSPLIQAAAAV